jgi:flagellar hook-associated protein 1 FlgK
MLVALDTNNNMQFSLGTTGTATNVNAQLGGGQLKANLDMRDTVVTGYMSSLNAFAIDLSDKVNNINSQGYGLDGSTGNNFFNSLVNITNPAVGAMSSVQVSDVAAYGSTINNQYRIDYSNAAAAGYQQEGASGIYWRVQQSSDGGTTWSAVPTSSVTVTADSAAIPAFRTLSFNGLTMKIDGTQTAIGAAGSGTFDVKLNRNAAASLTASITDLSKIAAAQTAANLPGDNTNAQAIAGLVSQNFIANTDPVTFYSNMVSTAGADAQSANTYVSFETAMVTQLESQRQSASGVNMDEEAVNMIQFQKSYEAAAKMISVGNDLLATLMGLIR